MPHGFPGAKFLADTRENNNIRIHRHTDREDDTRNAVQGKSIGKAKTGNSLNYGLDFMGGTSTEIVFSGNAPSNQELEQLVKDSIGKPGEVVQIQGVTKSAVPIESIIPMASVWAKPLIVPEPRKYSTAAAISVVTLPSTKQSGTGTVSKGFNWKAWGSCPDPGGGSGDYQDGSIKPCRKGKA